MTEDYLFVVHYTDGTTLEERAAGEPSYHEIDLPRVAALELVPQRDGLAPVVVDVADGATAWFARRRSVGINMPAEDAITIAGWRTADDASYVFLFADGTVVVSRDYNAV